MTIINIEYYDDIIGNLLKDKVDIDHYILTADKTKIKNLLFNRGECENSWSEQQIDRCLEAFSNTIKYEEINTNDLRVAEAVDVI